MSTSDVTLPYNTHLGLYNATKSALSNGKENMRPTRSTTCVDGDANRAVRGILEPSRHRQRRCKFTMNLRLSRPRSDRAPGYEVSRVLRTNGVQELAARGQPHFCDIQKKGTRYAETLVDLEATIHFWVVDETLPADGCAGFLRNGEYILYALAYTIAYFAE